MAFRVRTVRSLDEFGTALGAIGHYFGWAPTEDDAIRFSSLLPFERMHAVVDDGSIVAAAGGSPSSSPFRGERCRAPESPSSASCRPIAAAGCSAG